MARPATREPQLPWVDHPEDRYFLWLSICLLVVMLATGLVLNLIKLPEIEQQQLVDISPRLAKLILEKRQEEQPKPEAPKPEPKKEEVKKEEPKEEPKKEPPKPKTAREVAQSSGLIALQDELADLRESFALDDVIEAPQQTAGKEAVQVASATELLSSTASQSSGGIRTNTLNRKITTSELAQRRTTQVESKIQGGDQVASIAPSRQAQGGGSSGRRSPAEIERVFQQYKGSIFNLYNRALRKNPTLAGKFVVELTIAADGTVSAVKVISSELGDESLERKLVLKIKQFKFARADVAESVVRYPIDFLPS